MIKVLLADDEELIRSALSALLGVDPALAADALTAPRCPLSEREQEVLRLAGFDTPVAEIARQAHLSNGTVRNYLSAAVSKLGVANRSEAYRTARENGWL